MRFRLVHILIYCESVEVPTFVGVRLYASVGSSRKTGPLATGLRTSRIWWLYSNTYTVSHCAPALVCTTGAEVPAADSSFRSNLYQKIQLPAQLQTQLFLVRNISKAVRLLEPLPDLVSITLFQKLVH